MPLRCLDPRGQSIRSFDLADEQWRTLERENKKVVSRGWWKLAEAA